MIKALCFSLILAATLGFGADDSDALFKDIRTRLGCNLAAQDCETNAGGQKALFSVARHPIEAGANELKISGISRELKNPSVKISGVSMNMGNAEFPLKRSANGYEATLDVAVCTHAVMRYKLEIYEDGEPSGLFVYFDLRKRATDRDRGEDIHLHHHEH